MADWPSYFVKIVVHPHKFELMPKAGALPEVIAATEKLVVAADWGDNADPMVPGQPKWRRVVIRNFRLVDPPSELGAYALPPQQGIDKDHYDSIQFAFNGFSSAISKLVVAFDIDYVSFAEPIVTYTLDPVIIIRPDPGYGGMSQT